MSTCRSSGGDPTDEGGRGTMTLRAHEGLVHDLHDEVVVAPAKGATHAGQPGIAREIGGWIDLEDGGLPLFGKPEIDSPVAFTIGHLLPGLSRHMAQVLSQLGLELG